MKRSEALATVKRWKEELCNDLLNKDVTVTFAQHTANAIFQDILLASVADLKKRKQPTPEKRDTGEKAYTPNVASLLFDSFTINLVIEDVKPVVTMDGIRFIVNPMLFIDIKRKV